MNQKTVELSKCCHVDLIEGFKDNPRDHHDSIPIYTCSHCKKECEVEEVCAECLGRGEVSAQAPVYPGEPHMADIDTIKCPSCSPRVSDDEPSQDRD